MSVNYGQCVSESRQYQGNKKEKKNERGQKDNQS